MTSRSEPPAPANGGSEAPAPPPAQPPAQPAQMLETDDGEVGEDEDDGGDVSASCADLAFCSATAKNEQPLRDVVWTVEVGPRTERGSFVNAQGLRIVHWTWPASESTRGIVVAVHGIEVGRCIGPGWCAPPGT